MPPEFQYDLLMVGLNFLSSLLANLLAPWIGKYVQDERRKRERRKRIIPLRNALSSLRAGFPGLKVRKCSWRNRGQQNRKKRKRNWRFWNRD